MNASAPKLTLVTEQSITINELDGWNSLSDKQREKSRNILVVLQPLLHMVNKGVSKSCAVDHLIGQMKQGSIEPRILEISKSLGRKGKLPSRATFFNWLKKYEQGGESALAHQSGGSRRVSWGWESEAESLYANPTKPTMSTVALWLRMNGHESATNARVIAYINSLPIDRTHNSPKRLGWLYYKQNHTPYAIRDNSVIPVGYAYEGDGHTVDVYVAHPVTGNSWRPELTFWMDRRSQMIVSWTLTRAESAHSTTASIGKAVSNYDHVPVEIHVDPGSGFINHIVERLCEDLGIVMDVAKAGDPREKGLIEGEFNVFEQRVGKSFSTYCGHCRTDRALAHLRQKVDSGQLTLPSFEDYKNAVELYVQTRNHEPRKTLGCAPIDLWQQMENKRPLHINVDRFIGDRVTRVVRNWRVHIDNRVYQATELARYNTKKVTVEYRYDDDISVTIRTEDGKFICEAGLVSKKAAMSKSRIVDGEKKAELAAIKRKQRDIEEIAARNKLLLTHEDVLNNIEAFEASLAPKALNDDSNKAGADIRPSAPLTEPTEEQLPEHSLSDFLEVKNISHE